MKLRNIIKAFKYAMKIFIRYLIWFAIFYAIIFKLQELFEAIYSCVFPIAVGGFLGYLGSEQSYIVKSKNFIFYLCFIVICNILCYIIMKNEFAFDIIIFTCFGFADSIIFYWNQHKKDQS